MKLNKLYFRSSLRDNPRITRNTILIGPLSQQRKGGIKHTLDYLFCEPNPPKDNVMSILNIALAVFTGDKLFERDLSEDSWSRDICISVPVSKEVVDTKKSLEKCLSFLTGDKWRVQLRASKPKRQGNCYYKDKFVPNSVCLFSGGLDSLVGAINLLESGEKVILVGHHDFSFTASVQKKLYHELLGHYGWDKVRLEQFEVKIMNAKENSTRSRSILFIGLGLAVASSFGSSIPLYIPENGFIGINAPLTPGRLGSYSTRTTHPLYFDMLSDLLCGMHVNHKLENPFRHLSKGQVLADCMNPGMLKKLYPTTVSCAHPTSGRWVGLKPSNCGYCLPCLVRRAGLNAIGLDRGSEYAYRVIEEPYTLLGGGNKGIDLRGILLMIHTYKKGGFKPTLEILKSGSLGRNTNEVKKYVSAFSKGADELRALVEKNGCAKIRRFVG